MAESVFSAYDFEGGFYRPTSPAETQGLLQVFDAAITAGYEIFVLDYADPSEAAAALEAANRILELGYHAFVSTPALTGTTLGPWQGAASSVEFITATERVFLPEKSFTMSVAVSGEPQPSVEWIKDEVIVEAVTGTMLVLSDLVAADSGAYRVRTTNRYGQTTSVPTTIRVDPNARVGRLSNLSARTWAGSGEAQLTPGVVSDGAVQILAHAVGPRLIEYGVPNPLNDPVLQVVANGVTVRANDNWGESEESDALRDTAAIVRAFPLVDGSGDAALQFEPVRGRYVAGWGSWWSGGQRVG